MIFGSKPNYSLLQVARQFFEEDDWKFEQMEDKPIIRLGFKGKNASWWCYMKSHEEDRRLCFYSVLDNNVPEHKRPEVAEFLTRANYGLIIGNFEMDFRDGEIRYKTSVDVKGAQLTTSMVKALVYTNLLMVDRYYPGIMKVVFANMSPDAAIEEIEGAN